MIKLNEWLNKEYLDKSKIDQIKKDFSSASPFQHLELQDFFNVVKLRNVAKALENEDYTDTESDLYKFKQTKDLVNSKSKIVKEFYNFFSSKEFIDYIFSITGIKTNNISMSSLLFRSTDYLLCHDDQVENRKIAYVVNLAKNFEKKDGGSLQLLNINEKRQPKEIVKEIIPKFNNFIIFKVSDISFHQVEEVLSDKKRLTIGGWFSQGESKHSY